MSNWQSQYNATKDMFESYLSDFVGEFKYFKAQSESMGYSLLAGGKRLRPVLAIETARMIGLDVQKILPTALCLEIVHTYSLIHDDLPAMDDDHLRRGKPTCHIVYGEANAILAGDGLLNLAFETAISSIDASNVAGSLRAIDQLFTSAGPSGMIGGQSLDMNFAGKFTDVDELAYMHSLKTGALFRSCCLCPALIGDLDQNVRLCLQEYADHLGLLFQITDDILDVTGDSIAMGKTIGKDKKDNKATYVNILGLDESKKIAHETASMAKNSLSLFHGCNDFHIGLIDYILERDR